MLFTGLPHYLKVYAISFIDMSRNICSVIMVPSNALPLSVSNLVWMDVHQMFGIESLIQNNKTDHVESFSNALDIQSKCCCFKLKHHIAMGCKFHEYRFGVKTKPPVKRNHLDDHGGHGCQKMQMP